MAIAQAQEGMDVGGWDEVIEPVRKKGKRARQARTAEIPARNAKVPISNATFPIPRPLAPRTLTVGSSCSGSLVDAMALKELQITHQHVFGCDISKSSTIFATSNFKVQQWLHDVFMAETF